MTDLEKIKASEKIFLTPAEVAPVLGCDPQTIRHAAREQPELLGFPCMVIGTRTKIPRIPFLRFLGIETTETE